MVRVKPLSTRVEPETYSALLLKCSEKGCSTYEYLRALVVADVGPVVDVQDVLEVEEAAPTEFQAKLVIKNDGNDERRIKITD